MNWQKIETAPKEELGCPQILLCDYSGAIYIGFWNRRQKTWDDGDFYDNLGEMTHWMPLPPPPIDED